MEKNTNNLTNYYETLLRKHLGLIEMKIKVPVRDTKTLGLVYTPGVAASCKKIKEDLSRAYRLTNKKNSMLVVTDSSYWTETEKYKNWHNYAAIPYLEAFCTYYKTIANIDCYPILIDLNLIKNGEELAQTIEAIMPAYSLVEVYNVSNERRKSLENYFIDINNFAFISSDQKIKANEKLLINYNLVYAAVIRAALDCMIYTNLNPIFDEVLNEVLSKNITKNNDNSYKNQYEIFEDILKISLNVIEKSHKIAITSEYTLNNQDFSIDYVLSKYRNFLIEGEAGWVDTYPYNYLSSKKSNDENSLLLHYRHRGVIQLGTKLTNNIDFLKKLLTWENLDYISDLIRKNPEEAFKLTCKANFASIITNGTAILGLGDIGALAGLPVMEGKSVLFKLYGGTDVVPICIQEKDPDKLVNICHKIAPIFSAINLEDIRAPECFTVEPALNERTDYPVFHDDQHGTAVVVLAGIINALKLAKKKISDVKIVMNGAGAAGLAVTQLLIHYGAKNMIICDTKGAIYKGRKEGMNDYKDKLADITNKNEEKGSLEDIVKNSDIFIGLSVAKALSKDMVRTMNEKPIIFALANPEPEIYPEDAKEAGAYIVATGRSDFSNQINNSLAFPGIFRAAIDVRAKNITIDMKLAASEGIANLISDDELRPDYIVPLALNTDVAIEVAKGVARAAFKMKEARNKDVEIDQVEENIHSWFLEGELKNFEHIKLINNKFKI